ncbi:MAG: hypothetical protein HOP12_02800 [Candidatus Eisenbacteria bacterium]|uniref:DUF3459 domain-containing protein n=1 Tax=Eiseniibacteriota bacterium TaxID=2212470 RepID=A0A849SV68_UNCEI|nr:hypothetical protein [Candidatus Eisenbacteria bacterium]
MTYVGAPHIYYGDEIAMEGGRDPDCRRPFLWGWQQAPRRVEMHHYYRKLATLRNANPALRTGTFRTLHAAGMVYGFERSDANATFVIALNASKAAAQMPLDLTARGGAVTATVAMTGATETWKPGASVSLPAETGRVFRIAKAGR